MPNPRPLNLGFPVRRQWSRVALAISIVVHVLLFYGPIESRPPDRHPWPELSLIPVPQSPTQSDSPVMVYLAPRGNSRRPLPPIPTPAAASTGGSRPPELVPESAPSLRGGVITPPDSGATTTERGRVRIGPDYGDGVGWVRPVPFSPVDLARHLERSHVEHVDSAVTAIMQAFLDSLANEPGAALKLPDWTTTLAGSKFGLDSKYIYVAGLKIPAALLALLPIPGGNVSQDRALDHVIDMRADIEQAARRAQNMEDFKRAIRDIRDRKQRERDFERAQREPPPPADQPPPPSQP
ncbi:MAG TPA: hypothetical protein VGP80_06010 [Gemmatimonadales bacterium]|nr:hypothetical protein [Gemmatimonadales bacterium]